MITIIHHTNLWTGNLVSTQICKKIIVQEIISYRDYLEITKQHKMVQKNFIMHSATLQTLLSLEELLKIVKISNHQLLIPGKCVHKGNMYKASKEETISGWNS